MVKKGDDNHGLRQHDIRVTELVEALEFIHPGGTYDDVRTK